MSPTSLLAFLALVAFVTGALLVGVWRSARAKAPGPRRRQLAGVAVGLGVWLGVTAALAWSGWLGAFDVLPPPALFVLLATLGIVATMARSPLGHQLAHGVPLAALVGVQAFRIPLELLLHRLYGEGVLPVQVTYEGWNYDVVTGVLAVVLAVALARGPVAHGWVRAWNGLGLALVTVVVATAVLSLPTPFQRFASDPTTAAVVTTVPLIWLPTVLVAAAILGHLLVFRRLGEAGPERPPAGSG